MKRRCNKCGKYRVCRSQKTSRGKTQPRCMRCVREEADAWFQLHKEYKREYMRLYALGYRKGRSWLEQTKIKMPFQNAEEKLKQLFKEGK